jgi:hypothetical protein
LLWRALVARDASLAAMVLDLMVPPLASLVLGLLALFLVDAVWTTLGGGALPLAIACFTFGLLIAAVLSAWVQQARDLISLRELLALPWYVVTKIPIYVHLLTKRQVEWVRTKRDE